MELCDGGNGCDAVAAQLRQLDAGRGVDVDEAVHVADAEALHAVSGGEMPLGTESKFKGRGLVLRKGSVDGGLLWEAYIVTQRPV